MTTILRWWSISSISHSWRGPVTGTAHRSKHPEIEIAVFPHTEQEVQTAVFTLAEVVAAVTEAHRRAEVLSQ